MISTVIAKPTPSDTPQFALSSGLFSEHCGGLEGEPFETSSGTAALVGLADTAQDNALAEFESVAR
jgi:hypothetical protein